jgi:hypothetical protein
MADALPRPSARASLDEVSLDDFRTELAARDIEPHWTIEAEGVWSVVATREGQLIAHAASRSLDRALVKLLLRVDAHDAAIPRPPRVPREAADFRATEPARGAA